MILLSHHVNPRTLDQLLIDPAVKWGVIRGYRHSPEQDAFLEQLAKRGKVVMANDERDLYAMLSQRIITAAFALPLSYDRWLNSPALSGQVEVVDLFPTSERVAGGLVLAHSDFSQQQAEQWQAQLQQMIRTAACAKSLANTSVPTAWPACSPDPRSSLPPHANARDTALSSPRSAR